MSEEKIQALPADSKGPGAERAPRHPQPSHLSYSQI